MYFKNLPSGAYSRSLKHAITASQLHVSHGMLFFAHLQLAQCYASKRDLISLHSEYMKCFSVEDRLWDWLGNTVFLKLDIAYKVGIILLLSIVSLFLTRDIIRG